MKAWDLPIAHNPLRTRDDLERALGQLLEPLEGRFVEGGAGLRLGNSSAHYDEAAALLEGECRLLWGLAPLAAGGGSSPLDATILAGLAAGTDPGSEHYWGVGGSRDQRYVEMCAIAFALLIARERFWDPLTEAQQGRLAAWLVAINDVELPPTNWEFFRVMVNLALRSLGRPYSEQALERGFAAIDALYREDGWYQDETNYDLYNPFAFHFYGLAYAKLFGAEDQERAERFRERARAFAVQYIPWFGSDGSSVPFGRSLGYRFAASSFFSAMAWAGESGPGWGVLKGLALRNLRHWLALPILDHEGLLSIGYAYPNLLQAEQYNSPGSPYWALKAFLPLAFPAEHPFWAAEEAPLPPLKAVSRNAPPGLLACRDGSGAAEQVYLLNAGQYPCWESVNAAAKYAKFAYSNRFGFCVSHSSYDLPKTGCDSALVFSEGDGYWRERRGSHDRRCTPELAFSIWEPWPDVEVRTWLIPFGPWHARVHAIASGRTLHAVEGGFSLPEANDSGRPRNPSILRRREGELLASWPWASGGILDLLAGGAALPRAAELHKPEPNLNVLYPKVLVPILRGRIEPGKSLLATAVYAVPSSPGADWDDPPRLSFEAASGVATLSRAGRSLRIDLAEIPS